MGVRAYAVVGVRVWVQGGSWHGFKESVGVEGLLGEPGRSGREGGSSKESSEGQIQGEMLLGEPGRVVSPSWNLPTTLPHNGGD